MLHLTGRIAFRVDIGNFLEFQGALEGDRVVNAATKEQEVLRPDIFAGQVFTVFLVSQQVFQLARKPREFLHGVSCLLGRDRSAKLRKKESKQIKGGHLGRKSLGRGDPNFRSGVGIDCARRLARDHRAHDIADGQGF